jgi:hypothetical protein
MSQGVVPVPQKVNETGTSKLIAIHNKLNEGAEEYKQMFDIMNQELQQDDESEDELFDSNVLQKLKF